MRRAATRQRTSAPIAAIPVLLLKWFSKNARDLPWRRTRDPYAIWVSEIMLQQTQVKTVIPYWERWMRELPGFQALAGASSEKIHKLWEGLGYYTRVRNMQAAAREILEKHGGKFPRAFSDVLALPGVGRYTAGAICSIAFDQPTPILDGNVIRVLTRAFGIAGDPGEKSTNQQLWRLAGQLVSAAQLSSNQQVTSTARTPSNCSMFNQALMELGALVCTPKQPRCVACPIQKVCVARARRLVDRLPATGQRARQTARRFVALVVSRDEKLLVRKRPAGIVNAHLWEFPNFEVDLDAPVSTHAFAPFRLLDFRQPFCRVRHSITRYRILLETFEAHLAANAQVPGSWHTLNELQALPFASAHRKILTHVLARYERRFE